MTNSQFWLIPAIWFARHTIAHLPEADRDRICDYLRDAEPIPFFGPMTVPFKWLMPAASEEQQARYDFYLRRGLPIPPSLRTDEERRIVIMRKQFRKDMEKQKNAEESFHPKVTMKLHESDEAPKKASSTK